MTALATLSSVQGLIERTFLKVVLSLQPASDASQYNMHMLVVTVFWAEGRRDRTSLMEAQRVIAARLPKHMLPYRLSSRQGGAVLRRSLSQRPTYPSLKGEWDCWLIARPALPEGTNMDMVASIGKATAAMKATSLVTVQLGHRVVICHSTFLLPSTSIRQAQISTGRLALAAVWR